MGATLLKQIDTPTDSHVWGSKKESLQIQQFLKTQPDPSCFCNIRSRVLTQQQCSLLMTHMDNHTKSQYKSQAPDDLKLCLTARDLGHLVGSDTVQRLRGLMSEPEHPHKIILRRCAEFGKFIRFHLDHDARETLQASDWLSTHVNSFLTFACRYLLM